MDASGGPGATYRVVSEKGLRDPLPGWPTWLRVLVFGPLVLALIGFIALAGFVLILGAFFIVGAIGGEIAGWVAAIFMALVFLGALATVFIRRRPQ